MLQSLPLGFDTKECLDQAAGDHEGGTDEVAESDLGNATVRALAALATVLLLAGCSPMEVACTEIGAPAGAGVTVERRSQPTSTLCS
jgi:hypothetical protein